MKPYKPHYWANVDGVITRLATRDFSDAQKYCTIIATELGGVVVLVMDVDGYQGTLNCDPIVPLAEQLAAFDAMMAALPQV